MGKRIVTLVSFLSHIAILPCSTVHLSRILAPNSWKWRKTIIHSSLRRSIQPIERCSILLGHVLYSISVPRPFLYLFLLYVIGAVCALSGRSAKACSVSASFVTAWVSSTWSELFKWRGIKRVIFPSCDFNVILHSLMIDRHNNITQYTYTHNRGKIWLL